MAHRPRPAPGPGWKGVRAVVLGATGFIGRWVGRGLSSSGATVLAAVRDVAAFGPIAHAWQIDATVVPFDALKQGAAERMVRELAPDIVFNLIGYGVDRTETDPARMAALNSDFVDELARALDGHHSGWTGQRLVHVGSALEYGRLEGIAHEDRIAAPHTAYGATKLEGTARLRALSAETGLAAVTARLFTVYGPGEHPGRLLPTLMQARNQEGPVALTSGRQRRDFAYVEDVAAALLALATEQLAPGECINVATGRMRSVRDFARIAARVLHIAGDRLRFGDRPARDDEMLITGVDVGRLMASIGWIPPDSVAHGVAATLAFESRRGNDDRDA